MSRQSNSTPPSYCHHKASGKAIVRIDGKDHYLGPYGTSESHDRYARLIAEWRVTQTEKRNAARDELQSIRMLHPRAENLTVEDVMLRYWSFAESYYVKNGEPTKELADMKYALRPVRKLYGDLPAAQFGPLALKAVRQYMIAESKLSRGVINNRVNRIKRMWKWAVSEQLVPPSVSEGLRTVDGLRYGRTNAREASPVKPIDDLWINATLPYLTPHVQAMVQLQRLTGVRPCELVMIRPCDIDQSEDVWVYEPADHKNRWRGHRRLIPLGFRAQQLLKPFFERPSEQYLFSPAESEQWRNAERSKSRKSKVTPSQLARHLKARPKRPKRDKYDTDSYRGAVEYAVKRANRERAKLELPLIPKWFPLQIRHSRATEVRKRFGLEGAQVSLGHANANVTEVYAERNLELAIEIARQTG